jgi:hypothetical protein
MKDKGIETVIAVCTERKMEVDGIRHDFANSNFTTVRDYTRSVTRSIAVEAKKPVKPGAVKAGPSDDREISRAAIKVEVK